MIDPESSFIMYAECEVEYNGRAKSKLAKGNYLIVHKSDGTLQIHGSSKSPPINYQGPGAKLKVEGSRIISHRKSESIVITTSNIYQLTRLDAWSDNKAEISKTEKELVQKLSANSEKYFGISFSSMHTEWPSEYGPIDLLGINGDEYHVIEVKRVTAVLDHCSQLKRYIESLADKTVFGYIASPRISKNAEKYLSSNGFRWIKVDFDN